MFHYLSRRDWSLVINLKLRCGSECGVCTQLDKMATLAFTAGNSHNVTTRMLQSFVQSDAARNCPVPVPVPPSSVEMETVEPIKRSLLDLDSRFFPYGE